MHDEVFQWNQTNAMISAVTIMLSVFLVMYSINVNDGVVFFASICTVIIQSVVVCSPVAHPAGACENMAMGTDRVSFMQPFPPPLTCVAPPPLSCVPLKPRQVLRFADYDDARPLR